MLRQNKPCVTPFMLLRFLPSAVRGPVDFFAFARLAASFFAVTVMTMPLSPTRDVIDGRRECARARDHFRADFQRFRPTRMHWPNHWPGQDLAEASSPTTQT